MNDATNTADVIDTADPDILRQQIRNAQARAYTEQVHANVMEKERDEIADLLTTLIDPDDHADEIREWVGDDPYRSDLVREVLGFSTEREYTVTMTVTVNLTLSVTATSEDDVRDKISDVEDEIISIDTSAGPDGVSVSDYNVDSPDIDDIDED